MAEDISAGDIALLKLLRKERFERMDDEVFSNQWRITTKERNY